MHRLGVARVTIHSHFLLDGWMMECLVFVYCGIVFVSCGVIVCLAKASDAIDVPKSLSRQPTRLLVVMCWIASWCYVCMSAM